MKAYRTILALGLATAYAAALAQTDGTHIENGRRLLLERVEADVSTRVTPTWSETQLSKNGDEVRVVGYGTVKKVSDGKVGVILFDVKMYTLRRLAPSVSYKIEHWTGEPVNEPYLIRTTNALLRQRLEHEFKGSVQFDMGRPGVFIPTATSRAVSGWGVVSFPGTVSVSGFEYEVVFSSEGPIRSVRVIFQTPPVGGPIGNPGNAYTEGIAQAHAAEFVRSRHGSRVQVHFTGTVNHFPMSGGVDRVVGRGQWRMGDTFQWKDFRYDIQVKTETGQVVSANVNLTPDDHGDPNDQKFTVLAQNAVRTDFRRQSSAQITFLSARVQTLPYAKKSVTGEFMAGTAKYRYEVILESGNGRTERVTINRA